MARSPRLAAGAALALASWPGLHGCPAPASPDALVFVRRAHPTADAPRDLAFARLPDGPVEVLATPQREESWPYWSPVAHRIVFTGSPPGRRRGRLFLLDPATGADSPLSGHVDRREDWPAWSPAEARLVLAFRSQLQSGVELFDLASGERRLLAHARPGEDAFLRPSFSLDGRRIAAQRRTIQGESDIVLLAPDRTPEDLVADPLWSDTKPVFSRDGRSVFFVREPARGEGAARILAVDLDGRGLHPLPGHPGASDHTPAICPVRDEIAFVRESEDGVEIWIHDLASGAARALTDTAEWNEYAPRWSPDCERLVVTASLDALPHDPRVRVLDRSGAIVFETPGFSPEFMAPPP